MWWEPDIAGSDGQIMVGVQGVEVWPGRGYLVELAGGELQFVHDLEARLPPGVEPDRRFWDPPPVRRCGEPAGGTRRRPTPRSRPSSAAQAERAETPIEARPSRARPRVVNAARYEHLPYCDQPSATRSRTSARARRLLESLLDDRQRAELITLGHFWVHGKFGSVRLGRLYDITHRRRSRPDIERRLCVITRAHGEIPPEDEWTSMLLTLSHEPNRFFRVANVRSECVHGSDLRTLQAALNAAQRSGDPQAAAFLAADVGAITGGAALDRAAEWIAAHADLDPTTRDWYLAHHARMLHRARRIGVDDEWRYPPFRFPIHRAISAD